MRKTGRMLCIPPPFFKARMRTPFPAEAGFFQAGCPAERSRCPDLFSFHGCSLCLINAICKSRGEADTLASLPLFPARPHPEPMAPMEVVVQRVHVARAEVQVPPAVYVVRPCRPKEAAASHVGPCGIGVPPARRGEKHCLGLTWVAIEVPTIAPSSLHIKLAGSGSIVSRCGKTGKGIAWRQFVTYGRRVVDGLYHYIVISCIDNIIINIP